MQASNLRITVKNRFSMRNLHYKVAAICIVVGISAGCWKARESLKFVSHGGERDLRDRPAGPDHSPAHAPYLIIGFDGVNRHVLYDLLRAGQLPNLGALLGGRLGDAEVGFPHAHLSDRVLTVLP